MDEHSKKAGGDEQIPKKIDFDPSKPDALHSSKRSLVRALHHIQDFKRQIAEFFKTNPYVNAVDFDPNTGNKVHKIKLGKPMPVALENIAADAVVNLRNALDQACFAMLPTGQNYRYAFFPFAPDAAHFDNTVKGRCKAFPSEITNLIRGFKPYKGGNDLLWALNELCNTNKHGILAPVAVCTSRVNLRSDVTPGPLVATRGGFAGMLNPVWDRTKQEMAFFVCRGDVTVNANIKFSCHVVFCDVEIIDGQPAETVLSDFFSIVLGILGTLEAEAKRTGLV